MSRVKRGTITKKRHKKILKQAKGFWGQRKNVFTRAKETLLRAMAYAFRGRKLKKRDMRSLFITRIKAAAEQNGTKYNTLINNLKRSHIAINRKMLSQMAIFDTDAFQRILTTAER